MSDHGLPGSPDAAGSPTPRQNDDWRTPRHDGWTVERQHDFLAELGCHGNVAQAAAAVGMSASSAYRRRGREAAEGGGPFSAGWRAARGIAYDRLCDIAFERIRNGVPTVHFYKSELVGTKLVFSDRLLLGMLKHLRDDAAARLPAAAGTPAAVPADAGDAYAAAMDAFAVAIETGTDPVTPPAASSAPVPPAPVPGGHVAGTDTAAGAAADPAGREPPEPGSAAPRPSPGEGAYHAARVVAAQARLARGDDPFVPRFAGRIYPPHPDAVWLDAYPDGLTAADLAAEDPGELARAGLHPTGRAHDEPASRP